MGGRALKHLNPSRLSSEEVVNVFNHLQRMYVVAQSQCSLYLVPWIEEKTDHGDIDILVQQYPDDVKTWIEEVLHIPLASCKVNNNIISTPIDVGPGRIAQVDFICADESIAQSDWAHYFFSGGDFGLYMGRVAAAYGYVFAMNGLKLRHDPTKAWSKDIILTKDPKTAAEFLGYAWPLPRFRTHEDLWWYVTSSKLAHPWMFLPSGTNNDNRCRDKQRPSVVKFQKWLEDNITDTDNRPFTTTFHVATCRADKAKEFGLVGAKVMKQQADFEQLKTQNYKFGLGAVKSVLEDKLSTEELGLIMRDMQKFLPDKHTRAWILDRGGEDQQDLVLLAVKNAARFVALSKGHKVKM
jgi:hypothetical protein